MGDQMNRTFLVIAERIDPNTKKPLPDGPGANFVFHGVVGYSVATELMLELRKRGDVGSVRIETETE